MKRALGVIGIVIAIAVSAYYVTSMMKDNNPQAEEEFRTELNVISKKYEVDSWTIEDYMQYYKGGEEGLNLTKVPLEVFKEEAAKEVEGFNRIIYYDEDELVLWFDDFTSEAGKITIFWWSPKEPQ